MKSGSKIIIVGACLKVTDIDERYLYKKPVDSYNEAHLLDTKKINVNGLSSSFIGTRLLILAGVLIFFGAFVSASSSQSGVFEKLNFSDSSKLEGMFKDKNDDLAYALNALEIGAE